jgi:hypothetical protein
VIPVPRAPLGLVTILIPLLLAPTPPAAGADLTWSAAQVLDGPEPAARSAPRGHALVLEAGTLHAVWQQVHTRSNSELIYRRSHDGGRSWSTPQQLTHTDGRALAPVLSADGDHVHCVWKDTRHSDDGELFWVHSADRGASWSEPVQLTFDEVRSSAPDIAAIGDDVLIAWEDYSTRNARSDVELLRSRDRGQRWEGRTAVAPPVHGCPMLAPGPGEVVHAALCTWDHAVQSQGHNYEISYRRSSDRGASWDHAVRLTDDGGGDSRFPVIAASGGTVHVVWWDDRDDTRYAHRGYPAIKPEDDHNYEVYYKRSLDSGTTWGPDTRLTHDPAVSGEPTIEVLGDLVVVAWQDNRDGNYEIYLQQSPDAGTTWSEPVRLTNDETLSTLPSLAIGEGGEIYLLWTSHRGRGRSEIRFARGG